MWVGEKEVIFGFGGYALEWELGGGGVLPCTVLAGRACVGAGGGGSVHGAGWVEGEGWEGEGVGTPPSSHHRENTQKLLVRSTIFLGILAHYHQFPSRAQREILFCPRTFSATRENPCLNECGPYGSLYSDPSTWSCTKKFASKIETKNSE